MGGEAGQDGSGALKVAAFSEDQGAPGRPGLDRRRGAGTAPTVASALAGEAGQFPALDVADPDSVGVAEVVGEPVGPGCQIGGVVEAAGEQGGGGAPRQRLPARQGISEAINSGAVGVGFGEGAGVAEFKEGFSAQQLRAQLYADSAPLGCLPGEMAEHVEAPDRLAGTPGHIVEGLQGIRGGWGIA